VNFDILANILFYTKTIFERSCFIEIIVLLHYKFKAQWKIHFKTIEINFSNEVNNYYPEILTDEALAFITALHEKFNAERLEILQRRLEQQTIF
jgi:hypothetical protein